MHTLLAIAPALSIGSVITFLIYLLLLAVVVYVVVLVLNLLPLPQPVKSIAGLIIGLIGLLWLLHAAGAAL